MDVYKLVILNTGKAIYNENYNYVKRSKMFPSSIFVVNKLINKQIKLIDKLDADFYMLQEVTKKHFQNYYLNQYNKFEKNIINYSFNYVSSYKNLFVDEGKLTFIKDKYATKSNVIDLKKSNKKSINNSPSIVNEIIVDNKRLVLINVHLIPFKENLLIRSKQLDTLLNYAYNEFKLGAHVILGGDFNMESKFIHLDYDFTKLIGSNTKRGLRFNSKFLSIDGFIISPNIDIKSFNVIKDYSFSDHTPIVLEFSLK